MAFSSPQKQTRPEPKTNAPRQNEMPPPANQAPKLAEQAARVSWIQVPGQQQKPPELPHLPSLPTLRPISPLHGDVFEPIPRKPVPKESPRAPTPKRETPVRQPLVNTFALQAAQLERESHAKVGRQLSSTSGEAPARPTDKESQAESPVDESSSSPKSGFFSHFRKRPRKRMSFDESIASPAPMPISPVPQLGPIQLGGEKSLRNSVVMEDFFEDAQEEIESDLMKSVDEVLSAVYRPQHITIAPSLIKGASSHPPSSHKDGAKPPVIPVKVTQHVPPPLPISVAETPPKLPPLTIPKRGSSRRTSDTPDSSGTSSRVRRPQPSPSPLPRIIDDVATITIPGAYPLSSSPETTTGIFERQGSIPMSRSNTNLSVNLPGAYPREKSRYNSSSSGLSSAASYRTAFDPETWDSEEQKQKDEQVMLQQSLMDATRAMRALEKYSFTDWTERKNGGEKSDLFEETPLRDSPANTWPTPPYVEDLSTSTQKKTAINPARTEIDYFRFGIPSPR
jgi:hypothetical protein